MFKKILIANRGEIAVRIIRACRELDISTVAVYSDADRDALHVHLADEAVCIGPYKAKDSYLNMKNILSATVLTGAEAVHPGFGFLSENSKFAEMCSECNIVFIGPDAESIESMGNKSKAKEIMKSARVPVVPGSDGAVKDEEEALRVAEDIGYPVMIKASAGGGGRGIRIAASRDEVISAYNTAKAEARTAFGDDTIYMEKLVQKPRHVEIQILADNYGNTLFLGERDCSIQRKNQKVVEEAPSPVMNSSLRSRMGEDAVRAAKAVNYKGAGTIEFLLDASGSYYFMEMNTRIRVEHGITEWVTGIDLVKEQIRIAAGERLNMSQQDIQIRGHAIECRINAENPDKGFGPSPGLIQELHIPGGPGVRIDSAIYRGYTIPAVYDSMIGKIIVYGRDREEAMARMKRVLKEFIIEGVDTNLDFQYRILSNENFIKGVYDTGFIKDNFNI